MTRPDPQQIMSRHPSVSGKIRALSAAGYSRADIARLVERSYQQVRQVLVLDELRQRREGGAASGIAEEAPPFSYGIDPLLMPTQRLRVEVGGVTLPAEFTEWMKAAPGASVLALANDDGTVTLMSHEEAMRRAARMAKAAAQGGRSTVDEFIAERRAEAARELSDD